MIEAGAAEGADPQRAATDDQLVVAAQAGAARAFDLLIERHHAAILRALTRQVGDPELAADLAQETFLEAYRSLDRLTGDPPFAAWLFRIAWHRVLREWRTQRRRRLLSLDWLLGRARTLPSALRQADESAACHERDLLQRALDDLSPPLREALVLHSLGGFTTQEVARILNISPAVAGRRISRAHERFRRYYEARERGDDG